MPNRKPSSRKRPGRGKTNTADKRADKNGPNDTEQGSPETAPADGSLPAGNRRLRVIASVLLLFHLMAVVLPPLAMQTSNQTGPSPLVDLLIRPFRGYSEFMYLNWGYAFFAPDPGPSRLIQAAVIDSEGSVTETMYPNRENQWPRLLYHRHFMLTEYLSETYIEPGPPQELIELDPAGAELWHQARGRYEHVRQSMVDHLKNVNDGKQVQIRRIQHLLPSLEDYRAEPIELTDPRTYEVLLDQPIYSDAEQPLGELPRQAEEIPVPGSGGDATSGAEKANDAPAQGMEEPAQ